jgi:hypothetical protein
MRLASLFRPQDLGMPLNRKKPAPTRSLNRLDGTICTAPPTDPQFAPQFPHRLMVETVNRERSHPNRTVQKRIRDNGDGVHRIGPTGLTPCVESGSGTFARKILIQASTTPNVY